MTEFNPLNQPELSAPEKQELLPAGPETNHAAEHHEELRRNESLATSRETIAEHAKSRESFTDKPEVDGAPAEQLMANSELKDLAFQRLLTRTRKQLNLPDKLLSRVVHQPLLDSLSRAGEATVARPSGILFGSLVSLLGSSVAFYAAKHYGFTYNFLLFAVLFAGGFILGLILEAGLKLVHLKHR